MLNPDNPITNYYGEINTLGILNSVWNTVSNLICYNSPVVDLARSTLHASVFETGFHQQSSDSLNLERFSNGEFVYPDTSYNNLEGFSVVAQSQTRNVQIYEKIDSWHQFPPTETIAESDDIDLDGFDDMLLYNKHLVAIFESMGGKISAVFSRSESSNKIYQTLGNFVSYSGSETEFEGITNVRC